MQYVFLFLFLLLCVASCMTENQRQSVREEAFKDGILHCEEYTVPIARQEAAQEVRDSIEYFRFKEVSIGTLKSTWPQITGIGITCLLVLIMISILSSLYYKKAHETLVTYIQEERWKPDSLVSKIIKHNRLEKVWDVREDKLRLKTDSFKAFDVFLIRNLEELKVKQENLIGEDKIKIQPLIDESLDAKKVNDEMIKEGEAHLAALDIVKLKLKVKRYKIENNLTEEDNEEYLFEVIDTGLEIDWFLGKDVSSLQSSDLMFENA